MHYNLFISNNPNNIYFTVTDIVNGEYRKHFSSRSYCSSTVVVHFNNIRIVQISLRFRFLNDRQKWKTLKVLAQQHIRSVRVICPMDL